MTQPLVWPLYATEYVGLGLADPSQLTIDRVQMESIPDQRAHLNRNLRF